MLRKDYFIRLIEEFQAAVSRFLERKKEGREADIKDLYRQYVGDYELLRNASFEEVLAYASDQWEADERMEKLNMVAELLYAEGSYQAAPLRPMLLDKAYRLYNYVEANGNMFSIERRRKMLELRKELEKR